MKNKRESRIKNVLTALVILLAIGIYGFYKYGSNSSRDIPIKDPVVQPAKDKTQLSDKELYALNNITHCLNRHSNRIQSSFDRYQKWVDLDTGPTLYQRHVYGLYSLYDPQSCLSSLNELSHYESIDSKLPGLVKSYQSSLDDIYKLTNEAYTYYDHEDYKDDNYARGIEMHGDLVKSFTQYLSVDSQARSQIYELIYKYEESQISEKGEGGESLRRHMYIANHLCKLLLKPEDDVDIDQVQELITQIPIGQGSNHPFKIDLMNPHDEVKPYLVELNDFVKIAKERMRRIRDKVPYTRSEEMLSETLSARFIEGSTDKVLEGFNDLAERYNSLVSEQDGSLVKGGLYYPERN